MAPRALGVIPARGGSKGVLRKNLRLVAGEPLVAHAIRTAQESRRLAAYCVSTDDPEIAAVARALGAPVLDRPADLAGDESSIVPVLLHALGACASPTGDEPRLAVLLQPTAPIRTGADVDAVLRLFDDDPDLDSVISVCRVDDTHPGRMYHLGLGDTLQPFWPDWETARRQDLPPVYLRNGAIYAVTRDTLVRQRQVMGRRRKAYVMPAASLANVDSERDLLVVDVLVRAWKEGRL